MQVQTEEVTSWFAAKGRCMRLAKVLVHSTQHLYLLTVGAKMDIIRFSHYGFPISFDVHNVDRDDYKSVAKGFTQTDHHNEDAVGAVLRGVL